MIEKMATVGVVSVRESGAQLVDRHGRTEAYFPAIRTGIAEKQGFKSENEGIRGDLVCFLWGFI